jgi:hypothetical protein
VIEGLILGFAVGFLARVKPDLLAPLRSDERQAPVEGDPSLPSPLPVADSPVKLLLLATLAALLFGRPVQAHRLEAEYRVLPVVKVRIESWFETGDSPRKATVKVYRSDGQLLTEGPLDEDSGTFTFSFDEPDTFKVVVDAPGGHRKELTIPKKDLQSGSSVPPAESPSPLLAVLAAFGLLLGLAAFVLSVRNAQAVASLRRSVTSYEPATSKPDTPSAS